MKPEKEVFCDPAHKFRCRAGVFPLPPLQTSHAAPDKTRKDLFATPWKTPDTASSSAPAPSAKFPAAHLLLTDSKIERLSYPFSRSPPEMPAPRCPTFSNAKNVLSSFCICPLMLFLFSSWPASFPLLPFLFSAVFLFVKKRSYTENSPVHINAQCQARNSRAMLL